MTNETMKLDALQEKVEFLEKELKELRGEIKPQEKLWPCSGDIYFHIGADGCVSYDRWDNSLWDEGAITQGIYLTQEQAEQISQNRKVHTMLKELADFEPDWEDVNQPKHFLCWGYRKTKEDVDFALRWQTPNTVYFKTEEEGQKAIQAVKDKFGDDAIELYCKHGVI